MKKLLRAAAAAALLFSAAQAETPAGPRAPAVAGRFYPARAEALAKEVELLLKGPAPRVSGTPVALLVPHAAIEYSGAAAAKAYRLVKKGAFDAVIVLGTGHHKPVEGAAIYPGDYAAPGASLPYAAELAEALMKASPLIVADASAHANEHSIEVQVPFLYKRLGRVPLVAMTMNTQDLETARAIGEAIAKTAKGRRVLIVASSDLSHYPSGAVADRVDETTLAALATLDPAYFWLANRFLANRALPGLAVSYCGEGAVTATIAAARALGAGHAELLARYNSGDVVSERDYHHVVGYAAAAFLTGGKAAARADAAELGEPEKKELLALARESISAALSPGQAPAAPLSASPRLNLPGAVFVTLRDSSANLRGCVGSAAAQETLVESVAKNAVLAATADERFRPLSAPELAATRIEISILSPAKAVASYQAIRPKDGVILEAAGRSGVFLPQVWEQLPESGVFLSELCRQKAGLAPDCYKQPGAALSVFGARAFAEPR